MEDGTARHSNGYSNGYSNGSQLPLLLQAVTDTIALASRKRKRHSTAGPSRPGKTHCNSTKGRLGLAQSRQCNPGVNPGAMGSIGCRQFIPNVSQHKEGKTQRTRLSRGISTPPGTDTSSCSRSCSYSRRYSRRQAGRAGRAGSCNFTSNAPAGSPAGADTEKNPD